MTDLKPCPFCGNQPDMMDSLSPIFYICRDCFDYDGCINENIWNARLVEDELRKRIAELEQENRQNMSSILNEHRWIPVSERLPDENTGVLIFGEAISQLRHIGIAYHVNSIPQWGTDDGLYFHGDSYKRVTHWMPLPSAPEVKHG